ncbi:hypothetical protein FGO68_gene15188 [Halteria grandinella]|uniref:Uncharacterized protein n=1 Tax=Halteria grandinella TaxID=5974 RepID=A0A8J8T036_HALGN|nr:hypothetical protein FGO68_gene15188 [Halteria grandinella]
MISIYFQMDQNLPLIQSDIQKRGVSVDLKLTEKLHHQIIVSDPIFIDKVEIHAISLGGSTHQDAKGNKFIFYPVFKQDDPSQMELAVLSTDGCKFLENVGWHDGGQPPDVAGVMHWINEGNQDTGVLNKVQIEKRETREFIVSEMDNKIIAPNCIVYKIDFGDLSTVDRALTQICRILSIANNRQKRSLTVKRYLVSAFIFVLVDGYFCNCLLYYWVVMQSVQWQYKLIYQILIYIAFLVGVAIQDFIPLFLIFVFQEKGWCIKRYSKRGNENKIEIVIIVFVLLTIIPILISIAMLFIIPYDHDRALIFIIHFSIYFLLGLITGVTVYCIGMKNLQSQDRSNRLKNFLQYRLNKS